MIIRPATQNDAQAICDITNPIIRDTLITFTTAVWTPDRVCDDMATGNRFLVAELDGEVIGSASFGAFRKGPGYARTCEHSIQLAPEARGRGVGRALMQALESLAISDGMHVMVAGVSGANAAGIAFHAALGFAEVGRMPEVGYKFGDWQELVLMQKILT